MTSPLRSAFPFVAQLSADGRSDLGALTPARVSAPETLLRRGDRATGAILVTQGSLRVYYVTDQGREATLYRVEAGGTCVLALSATINDASFPAWADAGPRGATFVRVPPAQFHHLIEREPAFRQFVLSTLGGRIFDLMATLEEVGSVQLEQRMARHLLRWQDAAGVVTATQSAMAADLGTAREVVSRTLRGLERRRLVTTGRARVTIQDHPALERLADGQSLVSP